MGDDDAALVALVDDGVRELVDSFAHDGGRGGGDAQEFDEKEKGESGKNA